jgi:hypothetical protein
MSKTATSASTRNAGKVFSSRAESFLVSNAGTLSARSIAGRLGRTVKAVRRKAEKLGISLALN